MSWTVSTSALCFCHCQYEICQHDGGMSMQASPSDPENFPFVVLGNKVDLDEGRSRVVRPIACMKHCCTCCKHDSATCLSMQT